MTDVHETQAQTPVTAATAEPPRRRLTLFWQRLATRARVLAPWFSLALGILSALIMERGPRAGGRIAAAAIGVWLLILLQRWLAGRPEAQRPWLNRLAHAARRSSLMITQSLLQMKLFFALPFFVQASDLSEPAHLAFLGALAALCAASLWDPLTEHWLSRRNVASLLPATASFVALTAVLPGLGLSTFASMWIAACIGGAGAGLLMLVHAPAGERLRRAPYAVLVALALPAALALGGSRLVPAAPLRLVKLEFGNQLRDHWIVQPLKRGSSAPARLFCATAIASPLGVHDRLFHVWRKDGVVRARVELEVRGGRDAGYRTASRIPVGSAESGRFQCSVETAGGQLLGSKSIRLTAREGET